MLHPNHSSISKRGSTFKSWKKHKSHGFCSRRSNPALIWTEISQVMFDEILSRTRANLNGKRLWQRGGHLGRRRDLRRADVYALGELSRLCQPQVLVSRQVLFPPFPKSKSRDWQSRHPCVKNKWLTRLDLRLYRNSDIRWLQLRDWWQGCDISALVQTAPTSKLATGLPDRIGWCFAPHLFCASIQPLLPTNSRRASQRQLLLWCAPILAGLWLPVRDCIRLREHSDEHTKNSWALHWWNSIL